MPPSPAIASAAKSAAPTPSPNLNPIGGKAPSKEKRYRSSFDLVAFIFLTGFCVPGEFFNAVFFFLPGLFMVIALRLVFALMKVNNAAVNKFYYGIPSPLVFTIIVYVLEKMKEHAPVLAQGAEMGINAAAAAVPNPIDKAGSAAAIGKRLAG